MVYKFSIGTPASELATPIQFTVFIRRRTPKNSLDNRRNSVRTMCPVLLLKDYGRDYRMTVRFESLSSA